MCPKPTHESVKFPSSSGSGQRYFLVRPSVYSDGWVTNGFIQRPVNSVKYNAQRIQIQLNAVEYNAKRIFVRNLASKLPPLLPYPWSQRTPIWILPRLPGAECFPLRKTFYAGQALRARPASRHALLTTSSPYLVTRNLSRYRL